MTIPASDLAYLDHPVYLGLLADVTERPDDDVPKLIMADWLEDNGDPLRAEFIRLGFAVADARCDVCLTRFDQLFTSRRGEKTPPCHKCEGKFELNRRLVAMWLEHGQTFGTGRAGAAIRPCPFRSTQEFRYRAPEGVEFTAYFRKGFVSCLGVPSMAAWLANGPWLVFNWPLTSLNLNDRSPLCVGHGDDAYYAWSPSSRPSENTPELGTWRHSVPRRIFSRLSSPLRWPTAEAARAALVLAALDWARSPHS